MFRRHPESTFFPYTTLFRSGGRIELRAVADRLDGLTILAERLAAETPLLVHLHANHAGVFGPKLDRKSTRLNSSHTVISYAVFCLKKKNIIRFHCHHRDVAT